MYTVPIPALVPRPALVLMGHSSSSLYLLDHAIWSHINAEAECNTDIEVFKRWVLECGMDGAMNDVKRAQEATEERVLGDSVIVFGGSTKAKL